MSHFRDFISYVISMSTSNYMIEIYTIRLITSMHPFSVVSNVSIVVNIIFRVYEK
jgi:hypothetical protein